GNITTGEDSGVGYGVRNTTNQFKTISGTLDVTTRAILKTTGTLNDVGNGVALLEGMQGGTVLVFEPRVAWSGAATDGTWTDTTKWLAGVSPNGATLNARFGPTTAVRAVTVDSARTVKMLKFDSPNSYTVSGAGITVDAPAGQNGNLQVLQGSHTIQS